LKGQLHFCITYFHITFMKHAFYWQATSIQIDQIASAKSPLSR